MQTDTASRKHILLVDDERLVRETVKLLLCRQGHTVVEANNGAEALGLFTQARFDLVLTDYEMPFLKGNELALRIRQSVPQQPILMMTGFRHKAGPDNPVDAIINKPFNSARLENAVAEVLAEAEDCLETGAADQSESLN